MTLPRIVPHESLQSAETKSTCPYCGVGCGVVIRTEGARIVDVRGDAEHPANFGRLCTKGSTLHLTAAPHVAAQTRLLHPMQRTARGATPQRMAWDDAIATLATRLADTVQAHGPDAVGLYISGQLLTEDYYVFNKLAKGLLGTNNVDTNSRLCMSSAVSGYKATLGADAPPACYDDFADADLVFITGRTWPGRTPSCVAGWKTRRRRGRRRSGSSSTRAAPRRPRWPTCTCRSSRAATSR
jgi:assimilatory nitrate reductase catalytic subunit